MYSTAYVLVVKINCHQQKCPSLKAEQQMFCCNYTCQSLCKACTKIGDIKKSLAVVVIFTVQSCNVCTSNFLFHDVAWTNIHACLHVCARMIMTLQLISQFDWLPYSLT